jgi:hypothetical protein
LTVSLPSFAGKSTDLLWGSTHHLDRNFLVEKKNLLFLTIFSFLWNTTGNDLVAINFGGKENNYSRALIRSVSGSAGKVIGINLFPV